ncbi:hypothetical protein DCO56_12490 [Sphingobacterium athyrii]|uniref:Uncharacterized protein n=1 Tax=Sphingobacterium athyrii TaxID=2152717 RepID=A0A363NTY9_9SPHI|nr:hypothetical protein DCO56_12490 [Sphingobacterium athyrii]
MFIESCVVVNDMMVVIRYIPWCNLFIAQWLNEFKLTMFRQEFIFNAIWLHQFAIGISCF